MCVGEIDEDTIEVEKMVINDVVILLLLLIINWANYGLLGPFLRSSSWPGRRRRLCLLVVGKDQIERSEKRETTWDKAKWTVALISLLTSAALLLDNHTKVACIHAPF